MPAGRQPGPCAARSSAGSDPSQWGVDRARIAVLRASHRAIVPLRRLKNGAPRLRTVGTALPARDRQRHQGKIVEAGFVVDDAIVMIENISRYIEAGEPPMDYPRSSGGSDNSPLRVSCAPTVAQRIDQQGERRWGLPAARVIEVV